MIGTSSSSSDSYISSGMMQVVILLMLQQPDARGVDPKTIADLFFLYIGLDCSQHTYHAQMVNELILAVLLHTYGWSAAILVCVMHEYLVSLTYLCAVGHFDSTVCALCIRWLFRQIFAPSLFLVPGGHSIEGCQAKKINLARTSGRVFSPVRSFMRPLDHLNFPM